MSDLYDDMYEEPAAAPQARGELAFAGMGNAFAGPMGELTGRYIQARIAGANRATVDPRVNQRRMMASPEFAMAKALGISTPYNSGGRQIDPARMQQRAQSPSRMEAEYAQAKLAEFDRSSGQYPVGLAMDAAEIGSLRAAPYEPIYVPAPAEVSAPAPRAKRQPKQMYGGESSGGEGQPGPSAPQSRTEDEEKKKKKKKVA